MVNGIPCCGSLDVAHRLHRELPHMHTPNEVGRTVGPFSRASDAECWDTSHDRLSARTWCLQQHRPLLVRLSQSRLSRRRSLPFSPASNNDAGRGFLEGITIAMHTIRGPATLGLNLGSLCQSWFEIPGGGDWNVRGPRVHHTATFIALLTTTVLLGVKCT